MNTEPLIGRCQHCRNKLSLTSELVDRTGLCPHCGKETLLTPIHAKLPSWVLPTVGLFSIAIIVGLLLYQIVNALGWRLLLAVPAYVLLVEFAVVAGIWLICISWFVYVFL